MSLFAKKTTLKDQMRTNEKELRKVGRAFNRDQAQLEREEKRLEMEIKKLAKSGGNKEAITILAKQLVAIKKQKTRSYAASSRVQGISSKQKVMHANMRLTTAMGSAASAMSSTNSMMIPKAVAKTMADFEKANAKIDMTDELINDTLDDILNEDSEGESDDIVNQVLDEIGIEIGAKVAQAPSAHSGTLGDTSSTTDKELEETLNKLKAL